MKALHRAAVGIGFVLAISVAPLRAGAEEPNPYQRSYELEATSKLAEALAALDAVPAASQGYVYTLRRGWLLYLLGRYEEAIPFYRRAASTAPAALEPWLGLLLPQMAMRRWSDVETTAKEVVRREPLNYVGNARLAWAQYNLGKYGESAVAYRRLVEAYPADVEMRAGLGWALLKQGKGAEAAPQFREVLAVAPNHATAREGLQASGIPH